MSLPRRALDARVGADTAAAGRPLAHRLPGESRGLDLCGGAARAGGVPDRAGRRGSPRPGPLERDGSPCRSSSTSARSRSSSSWRKRRCARWPRPTFRGRWSRGRRCCRIAGPTLPRAVEPASSQRPPASPTWFPIPTSAGRSNRIDRAPTTIVKGSRGFWRSSGWHRRVRPRPMTAAPSIRAARRGCGARGPARRSPPCRPSVASPSWATRSRSDSRCATRTRGRTSSSARSVRSSRCSTSAGCLREALASGFQSR